MMPAHASPAETMPKRLPATELIPKPKPNYKWFEDRLRDNQISQRELARRLSMDAAGLNRRLKGKARLQLEEAARIAKLLHVTVDDVLVNAGVPLAEHIRPKGESVPLVGWVDSEFGVHMERVPGERSVEAPPIPIAGLKALRFQTSMSRADAFDGAVAYFRPEPGVQADAIGKLCVVTTDAGAILLRVVRPGYERGRYNLSSTLDGTLTANVLLESAVPVVWLKF